MGATDDLLNDIRAQLAPDDTVLKEARERRDTTREAAENFPGALRSFASGSLAHKTANYPVHQRDIGLDADAGVVLDRRSFPSLGPDSDEGDGPNEIVRQVRDHIGPRLRSKHPQATLELTKRAILVRFSEPMAAGEDPTVDLVVGLTRHDAPGLWIPNTEQDRWDPSHAEEHTRLLTAHPRQLRTVRTWAIRLAKAENKREGEPPLCSFNIEALALMFVTPGSGQSQALLSLWRDGAGDLSRRLTPDPAGVSAPIKIKDRARAVERLTFAADQLEAALVRDDDPEWVRHKLRPLWPDFVPTVIGGHSKARVAAGLKVGAPLAVSRTGTLEIPAAHTARLKQPRSYGNQAR